MAYVNIKLSENGICASAVNEFQPVSALGGASSIDEYVIPTGSWNTLSLGAAYATQNPGDVVKIVYGGIFKGIAGASLGNGTPVGVGSTNGILIPIAASGVASTSGTDIRYQVGIAKQSAVAGDIFSYRASPNQIV